MARIIAIPGPAREKPDRRACAHGSLLHGGTLLLGGLVFRCGALGVLLSPALPADFHQGVESASLPAKGSEPLGHTAGKTYQAIGSVPHNADRTAWAEPTMMAGASTIRAGRAQEIGYRGSRIRSRSAAREAPAP